MSSTPAAETDHSSEPVDGADEGFGLETDRICPLEALHSSLADFFPLEYKEGQKDVVTLYDPESGSRNLTIVRAQSHRYELTLDDGQQVWIYGASGQHKTPDLFFATVPKGEIRYFMKAGEARDRYVSELSEIIAGSTREKQPSRAARFISQLSGRILRTESSAETEPVLVD